MFKVHTEDYLSRMKIFELKKVIQISLKIKSVKLEEIASHRKRSNNSAYFDGTT